MQKKNDLVGLSPFWLIGLALALTFLLAIGVPFVAGPIDSKTWLTFGGSLISGACAIGAVVVATRNVNRQLRINLISREEERIERELPRLREIAGFFDALQITFDLPGKVSVQQLLEEQFDLEKDPEIVCDLIAKRLPLADEPSRQIADFYLREGYAAVCSINEERRGIERADSKLAVAKAQNDTFTIGSLEAEVKDRGSRLDRASRQLKFMVEQLAKTTLEQHAQIKRYETRLQQFRSVLETYFDN